MARSSVVPGFRFHPTDTELVMYYLKRKLLGKKIIVDAIAEVNIYDFSPWDLPDLSSLKNRDLEWFFFCPKSKKYSSGARYNRATETGFWKATGKDRKVEYKKRHVATIKTLVFHVGHAGNGQRTDWVMHEYRMEDEQLAYAGVVQDMFVLVKVFEKAGSGPKNGAQYGAPFFEEAGDDDDVAIDSLAIAGPVETATNRMDYLQNGSAAMEMMTVPQNTQNVCWTETRSSVVTFSANEMREDVPMEGPAAMEMLTVSQNTQNMCWTEPGSSIVTLSSNEIREDVPVNEDMKLLEELAELLGVSTKDLNGNNENEEAKVYNADKVNSMAPNEENSIYNDLNLDELIGGVSTIFKTNGAEYTYHDAGASTSFKTDGAAYTRNEIFTTDDLDCDLSEFFVD